MAEGAGGILVVGAILAAVDILPVAAIEADTPDTQAMADIEADTPDTQAMADIEADTAGMVVTVDTEAGMAGAATVVGVGAVLASDCISRHFPTITQRFGTPAHLTIMRTIITTNGTVTLVSMKP